MDKEDNAELKKQRKKWGVPNWNKIEEYDYIKHLNTEQLRWEFLRRDKKYRAFANRSPKPRTHFILGDFIEPSKRGDCLPQSFVFADSIRQGKGLGISPPPLKSIFFKKGDPDPLPQIDYYYGRQLADLWDEEFIIIAFNPFKPIKEQIKAAQDVLKIAKAKIKKDLPNSLNSPGSKRAIKLKDPIKLLRIIDAHNEGRSNKEIGLDFFGYKEGIDPAKAGAEHTKRALTYWKTL